MPDTLVHIVAALGGRYTIERELGRGGMATVYLAEDLKHDRRVALNCFGPSSFPRSVRTDSFVRFRSHPACSIPTF